MKRIAYAQVELPDGTLLKRQVVEFSEGQYLRHYPLTEELPFTEWRNEKYIIKGERKKEKGERRMTMRVIRCASLFRISQ